MGWVEIAALFAGEMKRRRNIDSVVVVHGTLDAKRARKTGQFAEVVDVVRNLDLSNAEAKRGKNLGKLSAFEETYPSERVWQTVFQDSRPTFRKFSCPQVLEYLSHSLAVLESVFARHEIAACLGELTMPCYRLAHGMCGPQRPYLMPATARFFRRFYFEHTRYIEWPHCIDTYERFLRFGIPPELLAEVDPVLAGIRERRYRPVYFDFGVSRLLSNTGLRAQIDPAVVASHAMEVWFNTIIDRGRNPQGLHWTYWTPPRKLARWLQWTGRRSYYHRHALPRIPTDSAYAIFLPNTEPEYTGDVQGWPFADQASLIRNLAQSLPVGMLLLVKDHRFMVGPRAKTFYQRILELPNVKLVDERIQSQELVAKSRIVFTVTGTVALESLCLEKPVLMFGRVFFNSFQGVKVVRDLFELPGEIAHALEGDGVDRLASARAALAAIYASSYPGDVTELCYGVCRVPEKRLQFGDALETELVKQRVLKSSTEDHLPAYQS